MTPRQMIGDFCVFGYSQDFEKTLQQRITSYFGIFPRLIPFGSAGSLFFYASYGDVAETDSAVVLKLGFLRSPDQSPITSQDLLQKGLIGPGFVQNCQLYGNGLIACLGKTDPAFFTFKTILGVPQLYYYKSKDGILCSDRLSCLVKLLDRAELNEDIVPMHFLFRSVPGEQTYYRQIKRLMPGQSIKWKDGKIRDSTIQSFQELQPAYIRTNHSTSLDNLDTALDRVVTDYLKQADASEQSAATLLSGGVDSSLLQYYINKHRPKHTTDSYSYTIQSAGFQRETEYAQAASRLFHTSHTFVVLHPEDFPGLLNRTIDILAQPPILETEPSMLSIAEYADQNPVPYRYFISGQGADTVFGLTYSKKIKGIHLLGGFPATPRFLRGLGRALPNQRLSCMLLKGAGMISSAGEADSLIAPANSIAVYGDVDILRRCFGDQVLFKALRYRRDFAENYLKTDHYLEKFHVIDLMTDTYELGVQRQQIFLGHCKEQLHPFFDDDLLRAAFAFPPDARYIQGFRPKYLLKDLLNRKTKAPITKRPKGFSIFESDLYAWMKTGPLREFIEGIELPGFISRMEFSRKAENPDYFLWVLLNFDLFRKRCLV